MDSGQMWKRKFRIDFKGLQNSNDNENEKNVTGRSSVVGRRLQDEALVCVALSWWRRETTSKSL